MSLGQARLCQIRPPNHQNLQYRTSKAVKAERAGSRRKPRRERSEVPHPDVGLVLEIAKSLDATCLQDGKSSEAVTQDVIGSRDWTQPSIFGTNAKEGCTKICMNKIASKAIQDAQDLKDDIARIIHISYKSVRISSHHSIVVTGVMSMPQPITSN